MEDLTTSDYHLRCVWKASALALRDARNLVSDWLQRTGHGELDESVVLSVNELLVNARRAVRPVDPVGLELRDTPEGDVVVTVDNPSEHSIAVNAPLPPPTALGGRGLPIVSTLADSLEALNERGLLSVTARFKKRPNLDQQPLVSG